MSEPNSTKQNHPDDVNLVVAVASALFCAQEVVERYDQLRTRTEGQECDCGFCWLAQGVAFQLELLLPMLYEELIPFDHELLRECGIVTPESAKATSDPEPAPEPLVVAG